MPLSDSQVKAEQAGPRRRNVSVGDSLFLVIESATRGGGKSFEGRMRFPPGRQGKQVPVRIGVYGKGVGKWSLKEARDEWDRKSQNLKWNQVKFKSECGLQGVGSGSSTSAGRRSGNSSANTYGKSFYVDYSRNYNPSKRTRFKGVWDSHGNYADLD